MEAGRDEAPPQPDMSVVVFGYRNGSTILQAVGSVVTQVADAAVDVVVATSGGDGSAALVRRHYPAVTVAESPVRLFPGGTRNLGLSMVRGRFVAFLEGDCTATPGWVQRRVALHRAGHDAVAGAMAATPSDGWPGRASLYLLHANRLAGHRAGPAHPYQSYGLSFRRSLLEQAGPFDETLRTDEDTAMLHRILELGVVPWFDPAIVPEHIGPSSMGAMLRDQFARGRLDSWSEDLLLPTGRRRRAVEATAGARTATVVLRTARRTARRARWTAGALRGGHVGSSGELLALMPAMVAGLVAYELGWCTDQMRVVHRRSAGPWRDAVPVPSGVRRRVATDGERVLALTFDRGPSPTTGALLEDLRRLGVRATFFVTGAAATQWPDEVRAIAAHGHVVGGGGWSGAPLTDLSDAALGSEVARANALVEELTAQPVRHVGPPGGRYDERVAAGLRALGLQVWVATADRADDPARADADGGGDTPGARVEGVLDVLTPGAVLRLGDEDDPDGAARAAMRALVEGAHAMGYAFVGIDHGAPP